MDNFNPLSEEHYQSILRALEAVRLARQHIALARQANIPLGNQEESLDASEKQLLAIKQVYFPGR